MFWYVILNRYVQSLQILLTAIVMNIKLLV